MPKKHPDDSVTLAYRIKPPEVWAAIRAEWEQGKTPSRLALLYDVSASTVQARRHREHWSRACAVERLTAPTSLPISALAVAEAALARAVEALAQGRAADAMALIKAGDTIGAFADFVAKLRIEAGRKVDVGMAIGDRDAGFT